MCSFLAQPNVLTYLNLSNTEVALEPVNCDERWGMSCMYDRLWTCRPLLHRSLLRCYEEGRHIYATWTCRGTSSPRRRGKSCPHPSSSTSHPFWHCGPSSYLTARSRLKRSSKTDEASLFIRRNAIHSLLLFTRLEIFCWAWPATK